VQCLPDQVIWYSNYCTKTFITYVTVTFPSPKCSSSLCVWDGHFSLTSSATKHVPASHFAPLSHFFISSLPHTKISNLTEIIRHSMCPIYLIFPNSSTVMFFRSSNYAATCHFLPHTSKYYFHHSVLKHP